MLFIATDAEAELGDELIGSTDDVDVAAITEWISEGTRRGIHELGDRLRGPEDATTVRLRDHAVLVDDGPFAESKGWISGFDIVECADLDEAIDYVSRHPMARNGRIEIRPFWPMDL